MRTEVVLLTEQFWARAGEVFPFPRDIERAAMLAYQVVVVKLPHLTADRIASWLRTRGAVVPMPLCEGEMAGCIIAYRGRAVIFVAGTDTSDEQRATAAHEVAHFIRHYLLPRERAVRALGSAIIEVLDGDRIPTYGERARGVLRDVPIGVHVHVIPRDDRDDIARRVEREADELALELMAPRRTAGEYLNNIFGSDLSPEERRHALGRQFGLPPAWFAPYAPDAPTLSTGRIETLLTQLGRDE